MTHHTSFEHNQLLEYSQMGAHNNADSAYISYEDIVYDITSFIVNHPEGRDILVPALGTDITDTFKNIHDEQMHYLLQSKEMRKRFDIKVVGKLDKLEKEGFNLIGLHDYQSRRTYAKADPLGEELKNEVYTYLKENGLSTKKSIADSVALLLFFYTLYGLGVYMAFIEGSALWCLLLGPISTFMAVNPAHTSLHGGFSKSKILNKLASYLMDAGGYSAFGWTIEHLNHHMSPHTTIDVQTYPSNIVRFFEHQKYFWYHKYQMFYLWFAFLFYTPSQFFIHTYRVFRSYNCVSSRDKIIHLAFKTIVFVLPIVFSFYLFELPKASFNLFLYILSTSYFSIFFLFIQHEENYLTEEENESWSVRQIETSSTWVTRNFFLEWLLGYFNYHIEHHLFPAMNPALYPKIQPIVKKVCQKYNVEYKQTSYYELVRSQIKAWKKFSLPLT